MNESKLKRVYAPRYEPISEGIQRCLICGTPIAYCEEATHIFQHNAFFESRKMHKQLLSYEEMNQKKEINAVILKWAKETEEKRELYANIFLYQFAIIQFSYSLFFWGYSKKDHPDFYEYRKLLWNTESFKKEMALHFSPDIFVKYHSKYQYDYGLREDKFLHRRGYVFLDRVKKTETR